MRQRTTWNHIYMKIVARRRLRCHGGDSMWLEATGTNHVVSIEVLETLKQGGLFTPAPSGADA